VQVKGRGDPEIARVAAAQLGFVVREQLFAAGLGRGAISHRLERRLLHRFYPGVYLVGHALAPLGAEMAAVLYYRGHAVMSHASAASIWGFGDSAVSEISLTIIGKDARSRPGLRLFRTGTLDRRDLRTRGGMPLTSPARTLLDLASDATLSELEQAVAEARVLSLANDRELRAAIDRAPCRKGAGRLRRLLDGASDPRLTRSTAERKLRTLLLDAQLPMPETNVRVCGCEVDFLWRMEKLVVEVDGHGFHGHRAAFERDRRRDQRLVAAGYRVIRVTWRQLVGEPLAVITRIAQALVAGAPA
jgi:very-short-patch-repair endonuclease